LTAEILHGILIGETGLASALISAIARDGEDLSPLETEQILLQNVSIDLAEKGPLRYPQVAVYCERLANGQREKFRSYSGTARLVIETRVSQDRLDGLERSLQRYTDSTLDVLHTHRGDWGQGVFFAGRYEVT